MWVCRVGGARFRTGLCSFAECQRQAGRASKERKTIAQASGVLRSGVVVAGRYYYRR